MKKFTELCESILNEVRSRGPTDSKRSDIAWYTPNQPELRTVITTAAELKKKLSNILSSNKELNDEIIKLTGSEKSSFGGEIRKADIADIATGEKINGKQISALALYTPERIRIGLFTKDEAEKFVKTKNTKNMKKINTGDYVIIIDRDED